MSSQDDRVRQAFSAIEGERPAVPGAAGVRVGLIGRGIGASLTPIMHEAEGCRLGLNYRYDLIDFDRLGLDDRDLGAVVKTAAALGFDGLNITYPFKQTIIALLDDLSAEAAAIGAVNTVILGDGRSVGHNTDFWGFTESLRIGLGAVSIDHVAQFGAGGAGAAVAHALVRLGAKTIDLVDIDAVRAQSLADSVSSSSSTVVRVVRPERASEILEAVSGIVNTTPVGMAKHPGLPLDPVLLNASQWVADIIYFPRETDLIVSARARGCKVLPGGGMAIHQAVRAFSLFTGLEPDCTAMGRTFAAYA